MNQFNQYRPGLDVAVIGMAAKLPGANNIKEFYHNLKSGIESIEVLTEDELRQLNTNEKLYKNENYVNVKACLQDPDYFDAMFFGYTEEEAKIMDPQMRILHQCTWEALENAGYDTEQYKGVIGLFAGGTPNPLWEMKTILSGDHGIVNTYVEGDTIGAYFKTLLHDKDLMSTRVAYKLNFTGPALTVFTSCSTSLVSIHLAVQSILSGECDIALAGGVSVNYPKRSGYLYQDGMILSSDGHCRSFDAEATGTIFGDGVGMVVLKNLDDAIRDGDTIYSIIKGTAINNDGSNRIGYTAPGIEGQAQVIKLAQQVAQVEPESIVYIEGHGSATKVGDSIELEAMKRAFSCVKFEKPIAIGSVKTNIGHLNSASGIAGFIKTVLMLKNKELFPCINHRETNYAIDSNIFYVNTELKSIASEKYPLRAGVSSFGVGGTNAHIVLEEPPKRRESSKNKSAQLILLSAKTESAIKNKTDNLLNYLKNNRDENLADIAYTLKLGRKAFQYRKAFVVNSMENAIKMLSDDVNAICGINITKSYLRKQHIVFMFSGQGSQYVNMGREIYENNLFFKNEMDKCFDIFYKQNGYDLKSIIYPCEDMEYARRGMEQFEYIQPILFIFEYSMTRLLNYMGILPDTLIGYSLGEIVAACIAGVFTLEEAMKVITKRGEIMRKTERGMMLSVPLKKEELAQYLNHKLSLAIDNGLSCIISGLKEDVQDFEKQMLTRKIICMPLKSLYGAHSHLMEPILKDFYTFLSRIELKEPKISLISNITGKKVENNEIIEPEYWVQQMRQTVNFAGGINEILKEDQVVFIEIGPGRDLSLLVHSWMTNQNRINNKATICDLIRTVNTEISDEKFFLNRLGYLWSSGVSINWECLYTDQKRNRIDMPTYPFESKPYWLDNINMSDKNSFDCNTREKSIKKKNIDDWLYIPSWKLSPLIKNISNLNSDVNYIIFTLCEHKWQNQLLQKLRDTHNVTIIVLGDACEKINNYTYKINVLDKDSIKDIFKGMDDRKCLPHKIIHPCIISTNTSSNEDLKLNFDNVKKLYLDSLIGIVKAIDICNWKHPIDINIITNDLHDINGEEVIHPEYSILLSTAKIISQEHLNIHCRCIDIEDYFRKPETEDISINNLIKEFDSPISERVIAYRGRNRWTEFFEPISKNFKIEDKSKLKNNGVYLITGGLGDVGYCLANYLLDTYKATVILINRSEIGIINEYNQGKIEKLNQLRKLGGKVIYYSADIADIKNVSMIINEVEQKYGEINGVIHTAGVIGKGATAIREMTDDNFNEQFHSKVYGLIVLEKIFKDKKLDFFISTSSLACIIGGLGDVAYAAANIYMDYFMRLKCNNNDSNWMSVNWETWYFEREKNKKSNIGINRLKYAMEIEEGIKTFERITSEINTRQIVISSGDIDTRLQQWLQLDKIDDYNIILEENKTIVERPQLLNNYVEPKNIIQEELALLWEQFFGIRKIGVKDSFFDLGGDSLKAINIIAKIRKKKGIQISLVDFFENPTIEAVAQLISQENLSSQGTKISIAQKKEYYTASAAQRRLYILNKIDEKTTAYNEPILVELVGDLDVDKLQNAIDKIILRHEVLRTSFEFREEQLVQIIYDNVKVDIEHIKQIEDTIDDVIEKLIQPFDLSKPSLMRVSLIDLEHDRKLLIIDMHHIITDAISEKIFIRELTKLYSDNILPELEIQYKDYSEWQNDNINNGNFEKQEEYWLSRFADEIPILNLPLDYPRTLIQNFEGDSVNFEVSRDITLKLKELIPKTGVTMQMVLLSAFNILLSQYTGQEDIIVGTPVVGRTDANLENVMGIFVNTLALRNNPKVDKKYIDFLMEVKENCLKAYENQNYQFETLVDKLNMRRDTSRNPLFDVMFNIINKVKDEEIKLSDITLKQYVSKKVMSKFDLVLNATENESSILLTLEYCTKLFKKETIERLLSHYVRILSIIGRNNEIILEDIHILSEKETNQILYEFNNTKLKCSNDRTLVELFEEQVRKTPNNIAVVFENEKLTYSELNIRANKLGRVLRDKGIKKDSIVGIMVEKSLEMIIGLIGILKAGGAYMPIDPEYPKDRIEYMLDDSNTRILLGKDELIKDISFNGESIDLYKCQFSASKSQDLEYINELHDSAYVIYTSGTTGKPKGVIIEHKNLITYVQAFLDEFKLTDSDSVLQQATYCFDGFVDEVYPILMVGGKFVICKKHDALDVKKLQKIIVSNNISVISCSPLFLNELNKCEKLNSIHTFISGGDILKTTYFNKLIRYAKVYNTYGPTETTVCATYYKCEDDKEKNIPIGKPIKNYNVYILDKNKNILPIGVPGELYVSGDGVARGYLNKPELTKEKFIDNPFEPGKKMYRTGDIVRWVDDGNIEYIGRNDDQVKIRGYRVEIPEIEKCLLKHPEIKETTVMIKNINGINSICCYYSSEKIIELEELKSFLMKHLPSYMMPSKIFWIEKFPINSSGKLDRNLLSTCSVGLETTVMYVPPQNRLQSDILYIWKEILKLNKIGIDDNFFDIGGNSMSIMLLSNKLRASLGLNIEIHDLFRFTTVRSLVSHISLKEEQEEQIIERKNKVLSEAGKGRERLRQRRKMQVRNNE